MWVFLFFISCVVLLVLLLLIFYVSPVVKSRAGHTGATGSTGATGFLGFTGEPGLPGTAATGVTGGKGHTGATGGTGAIRTDPGPTGPTGTQGLTGAVGTGGFFGPQGSTGFPGITGPTGSPGQDANTGATGLSGRQGPTGDTGTTATTGATGLTGLAGATGVTGIRGFSFPTGATGVIGPTPFARTIQTRTANGPTVVSPASTTIVTYANEMYNEGLIVANGSATQFSVPIDGMYEITASAWLNSLNGVGNVPSEYTMDILNVTTNQVIAIATQEMLSFVTTPGGLFPVGGVASASISSQQFLTSGTVFSIRLSTDFGYTIQPGGSLVIGLVQGNSPPPDAGEYLLTGTQFIGQNSNSILTDLNQPAVNHWDLVTYQSELPGIVRNASGTAVATGQVFVVPVDGVYCANATLSTFFDASFPNYPNEILAQFVEQTATGIDSFAAARYANGSNGATVTERICLNGLTHLRAGNLVQIRASKYQTTNVVSPPSALTVPSQCNLSLTLISDAPKVSQTRVNTSGFLPGVSITNVPILFPTLLYTANTAFAAPSGGGSVWTFPVQGWYMIQVDLPLSFSASFTAGETILIWFEQITPVNRIINARQYAWTLPSVVPPTNPSYLPQINFTAMGVFPQAATGRVLYANNAALGAPAPTILANSDATPNRCTITLIERTNGF